MKRSPQQKFLLVFESVKRALLAAKTHYHALQNQLKALEPFIDAQTKLNDDAALSLLSAMAIVDHSFRFSHLFQDTPLVSKKHPEVKQLIAALANIEKGRHYLQHMRGDLLTAGEVTYPALGSLAWARGSHAYLLALGQVNATQLHSLVVDSWKMEWVSALVYEVKDISIDFDNVLHEMQQAFDWLSSQVTFSDPAQASLTWGPVNALAMSVSIDGHDVAQPSTQSSDITSPSASSASVNPIAPDPPIKSIKFNVRQAPS